MSRHLHRSQRWAAINHAYLGDEQTALRVLLAEVGGDTAAVGFDAHQRQQIHRQASRLLEQIKRWRNQHGGLEAFLQEYDLSSQEGVILMCLAEALVRIPDAGTADRLIRDKLGSADWQAHLGHSDSLLVNAGTWGLMLTGRLVNLDAGLSSDVPSLLKRLLSRSSEPVLRLALKEAMRIIGQQFVMGQDIEQALTRSQHEFPNCRYSFDMLGEAALGRSDSERYFERYQQAIAHLARAGPWPLVIEAPGISVKLSALHPRFEMAQRQRILRELLPRVHSLAEAAMAAGIGFTLDAEESERLSLTLEVFESLLTAPVFAGWKGLGLAVQAYQKRAPAVIDWLLSLAQTNQRRIMLRLVKGAYWDSEIKRAQQEGLVGYPVYTRKAHTDVAYLACARRMLAAGEVIYSQFATHNAHTVAAITMLAGMVNKKNLFEFQRLHGMGGGLFDEPVMARSQSQQALEKIPCRIYAPVGGHKELLPYLVRRLLENGSNTSFVNQLSGRESVEKAIADPIVVATATQGVPHPKIPLPKDIFGDERRNSQGVNVHDAVVMARYGELFSAANVSSLEAQSITSIAPSSAAHVQQAMKITHNAFDDWQRRPAEDRANILERAAELLESARDDVVQHIVREGGRCVVDALDEVREAVDFCRYYAQRARLDFSHALSLSGPSGESNEHSLHGRGVFVCISPWNFPLAIFTGQIAAALAAGNTVVAKPAALTPRTALAMTRLFHQAGVPTEVLQVLPGASAELSESLLGDPALAGVAFTGSTDTARNIVQRLAQREGAIVPLIAETGGQNVMLVDSSALPEQVVEDVVKSAFNSAGQRCSALRVLFVQDDIAERVVDLLREAMAELVVGDPGLWSTDVGPVIDAEAKHTLMSYIENMKTSVMLLAGAELSDDLLIGNYVPPTVFEIESLAQLKGEVFGPILHVIRYGADELDKIIDDINNTGYGLTLGVHSRIASTIETIHQRVRVGNLYVNRDMVGAVVGVQPFGGEGLSGTGPKAGGRFYLHRFATERVLTTNTSAMGGDVNLLLLD